MDPNTQRAEAERWLGIAVKLLTARDFLGSRTFAIRARESDPNNAVSDQILAVVDTVLAGEKRVDTTQQPDWYAVLQLPRMVRDPDLIATHYRRLALLLSPDHNRFPFADYALQLTVDAWSVLSDPTKKWLFDNELALSLQRGATASDPHGVGGVNSSAAGSAGSAPPLNTFQFFQPPAPASAPPPPPQPTLQMWQQQVSQREFMPSPQTQPPPSGGQQLPPQWQMRDPTAGKGGDKNKGSVNGIGGRERAPPPAARSVPPPVPTPVHAPPPAAPAPVPAWGIPTVVNRVVEDGNVGNSNINVNDNDNNCSSHGNVNNANAAGATGVGVDETNDHVVEEVESFWTCCPYCLYVYEYQKMYQDCTLRCHNCRRGFHALQIPNPPLIGLADGDRGSKDNEGSFCSWSFFPLAFSMTAWKKHNQFRANGSSNWVPFSPMFANPGGDFQWFVNNGNASVGPRIVGSKSGVRSPRIYVDDDEEFVDVSDPSDSDSSDHDWRNPLSDKKKKKKKKKKKLKRAKIAGRKRGRPRQIDKQNEGNQNTVFGGGVSVGGEEDLEDESETQAVVVGLVAGRKSVANKNMASAVMRKHTRRSMKDMGNLDLNVEFNNEGDEHAPSVSAVNGEEDVIENIGFFEGLDEFLSTLPILNVGDEKAKPS